MHNSPSNRSQSDQAAPRNSICRRLFSIYLIGIAILIAKLLTNGATLDMKHGSVMYIIVRYVIGGLVAGTLAYVFYCSCIGPPKCRTNGKSSPSA
jgi:hypothetical protein